MAGTFHLGREKPKKCQYIFWNGERCENKVPPDRGYGATHCWDHTAKERDGADNHPGKMKDE